MWTPLCANTNNINKTWTWTLLQTTVGKDEMNIVFMWKLQRTPLNETQNVKTNDKTQCWPSLCADMHKNHNVIQSTGGKDIRDDFFQLFNWFQLFSSGEKLLKVAGHSQNRSFERGYRWFQLFFIDFQLFCFLTIIIPETCSWIIDIWWYVSEQEGTNTQEEINKQCTDGETTFILCDVTKDQQVKVCEQTKGIFLW